MHPLYALLCGFGLSGLGDDAGAGRVSGPARWPATAG